MNKYNFGFSEWENGWQNDLPDNIFDKLTPPEKFVHYRPSWGNYSESARKAYCTRNFKRSERNKDLFLREVLPVIKCIMHEKALFETAIALKSEELMREAGFRFWYSECKKAGAWIKIGDTIREGRARELGAKPFSHSQAFNI